MTTQSAKEFYAEIGGKVEGILFACSALVATHQNKEMILQLIRQFAGDVEPKKNDNEETISYKLGIQKALQSFEAAANIAQSAAEINALKKQTGSH